MKLKTLVGCSVAMALSSAFVADGANAQSCNVTVNPTRVLPGGSVTVSVSGCTLPSEYYWVANPQTVPPPPVGCTATTPCTSFTRTVTSTTTFQLWENEIVIGRRGLDVLLGQATVTVVPVPSCTLSANPTSVVTGGSITLTPACTGTVAGTTTYSWGGPGTAACAATAAACTIAAPATPGTATYTFTANNGLAGATSTASTNVTVFPPTPSCSLAAAPSSVITGGSVTLTATCSGTLPTTTYAWTGTGTASCSASSATCTITAPTTPGSYPYSVTASNGSGFTSAPATTSVSVFPPTPSCTLTDSPPRATVGQPVTLTASCTGTLSTTTYTWTGTGSTACSPTSSTCTIVPRTPGDFPYTVVASNGAGFASAPASTLVSVFPPAPSCSLTAAPSSVGPGGSVTLTGTCTNTTSSSTYQWGGPGTAACSTSSSTCTVTAASEPGTYDYTLIAGNGFGVRSNTATASVTVQPAGAFACSLTLNPPSVAPGGTVTLSANCTGGGVSTSGAKATSAITYAWSGPGTANCSANSSTCTITAPTTPGSYTYSVTAINGTLQSTPGTATLTVTPPPPTPNCTLTASPASVAPGANITLTGTCSGTISSTTYAWTGSGTAACSTGSSTCVVSAAAVPGPYTYTLTASNGSGATSTPASATVTVSQTAPPSCTLGVNPTSVSAGGTFTLAANCTGTTAGTTFTWSGPGTAGCAPTSSTCTVTAASAPGTYSYTVSASNGGGTSSAPVTVTLTVVQGPPTCTLAANPSTVTGGQNVTLNATCNGTGAGTTFTWSGPGTGSCSTGSATCTLTSPTAAGAYTYSVVASNGSGLPPSQAASATVSVVSASLTLSAGDSQTVVPGQQLTNPLVVRAVAPSGAPVPGVAVLWSSSSAGDQLSATTVVTDAAGFASIRVTPGSDTGGRTITARLIGGNTVTFTLRDAQQVLVRPATQLLTPMAKMAIGASRVQLFNIREHLDMLRYYRNSSVLDQLRLSVQGRMLPSASTLAAAGKTGDRDKPQRGGGASADKQSDPFERWGVFANGTVDIGKQSTTGEQTGYKLTTDGLTVGVDYRLDRHVLGAAFGYFKADADLDESAGSQDAKGLSASVFGMFVPAENAYVDVIANFGRNDYDSRRRADLSEFTSSTKGNQYSVAISGGYNFTRGSLILNPYVRFEHVRATVDGFSESGGPDAIGISDQTIRASFWTLGGQASYTMSTSWGVLIPNARVELQRQSQDTYGNVNAQLVRDPLTQLNVQGPPATDRTYGTASVGASAIFPRGVSAFGNYERTFGKEGFNGNKYTLGVRVEF